tara:strand:+ start:474 stop:896 length:423 start_codon:yes stop_codon:yes gene_type:complete
MNNFSSTDEFNLWKESIPFKISNLKIRLKGIVNFEKPLIEVIGELSNWILENYQDIESMKSDSEVFDELICYIGELYREKIDGKWSIELDESDVYYGRAIVCNTPPYSCPSSIITTFIHRKKPNFIIESINKQMKRFGKV